jgi:L-aminopeptidase/D-esterase-like protein
LFVAFSTANARLASGRLVPLTMPERPHGRPLRGHRGATEEAIVNALVAGRTMKGRGGHTVLGLPHEKVKEVLAAHGLSASAGGKRP